MELKRLRALIDSRWMRSASVVFIFASAMVLGLETYPAVMRDYGAALTAIDRAILGFFVAEILLRILSHGRSPWKYFRDPWNVFDFIIVSASLLPMGGAHFAVLRLIRVIRLLRLFTAIPRLQVLVGTLLHSIPSIGYVALLLMLHMYVYAVLGVSLFGNNDPLHFGSLPTAMLTLFQILTLEGWVDVLRIQALGCAAYGYDSFTHLCVASQPMPVGSTVFFVSFIVFGTMIILNLFIGIIMNGMQEQAKEVMAPPQQATVDENIARIDAAIGQLQTLRAQITAPRSSK